MSRYDDIINLPHHVSTNHPRMSMHDRAAQFAPFAALVGYDDAVAETARLTEARPELDEQEQKYSAELETTLAEYAELKTQGEQFDPVELYDARQAIRHEKEQNVINRVQRAYGDKYNPLTMFDSKREASMLLREYADEQAVQKMKREQQQKIKPDFRRNQSTKEKRRVDWER